MRLTFSWRSAARLPSVIVSAASTDQRSIAQPVRAEGQHRAARTRRRSTRTMRAERGRLHARGHEAGDRRGRALVRIGRPHVERHRRDLEAERDEDEAARRAKNSGALPARGRLGARCRRSDSVAAGRAVDQRDAVEQEAGRERADQEVLHRRLRSCAGCGASSRSARRRRATSSRCRGTRSPGASRAPASPCPAAANSTSA